MQGRLGRGHVLPGRPHGLRQDKRGTRLRLHLHAIPRQREHIADDLVHTIEGIVHGRQVLAHVGIQRALFLHDAQSPLCNVEGIAEIVRYDPRKLIETLVFPLQAAGVSMLPQFVSGPKGHELHHRPLLLREGLGPRPRGRKAKRTVELTVHHNSRSNVASQLKRLVGRILGPSFVDRILDGKQPLLLFNRLPAVCLGKRAAGSLLKKRVRAD